MTFKPTSGDFNLPNTPIGLGGVNGSDGWAFNDNPQQAPMDDLGFNTDMNMGMGLDDNNFTWEMIGLGLEEPLPPQESIDELFVFIQPESRCMLMSYVFRHEIYFEKIHPSVPIIHKFRYLAAMNL